MKIFFYVIAALIASLLTTGQASALTNQSKPLVIILLGAPLSGKGTQAKILTKNLHLPHISTGDLLRENIKRNTELGKKAQEFMNQGQLVPDELVLAMLFARIQEPDTKDGYLLDGFPRTVAQADAYEDYVGSSVRQVVINIEVPDSEILKRVEERAKEEGRADDTPEIAARRLEVYRTQTEPLIDYFNKKNILYRVDGMEDVSYVNRIIMHIIYPSKDLLKING